MGTGNSQVKKITKLHLLTSRSVESCCHTFRSQWEFLNMLS